MATVINADVTRHFLSEVDRRYRVPGRLYLLGGSALQLLGSVRPTLDLDYFGHDLHKNRLQQVMDQVATDMQIDVEAVPFDEFVPIPEGAEERHQFFARFGLLDVYVFDPYSISLSKLDRGFDVDIDDVTFLLQNEIVDLANLEEVVQKALSHSKAFDLDSATIHMHLNVVRKRYGRA